MEWIPPAEFAERCPYAEGTFWVGRSPETGEALGYIDDRHIFIASGNRAGKGTTTLINNLCTWPGSIVVVDPKGENATVTAARRGPGSEYCEGMGQSVYVLDPFEASDVPDEMRGCFNPLDEIDPKDPKVLRLTAKIADAIVTEHKGISDTFWKDSARKLVKGIILHVLTAPRYEGHRNLVTVRELINRGDIDGVKMLKASGKKSVPGGHDLLWEGMACNEGINGIVAGIGEQMSALVQADAKLFQSMLQSVDRETEWLDDELIQHCVSSSSFKISDLKRDPKGISIYLCLPEGDMTEYNRWLRMMLTLVVRVVEHHKEEPACGHRILMVMDEFLALERIKAVERAASYIAGFHLTMVFVVQGLSPLQEIYGKGWENIIGNCGLKIFFAVDEPFAREYISKMIGDTEVRPGVRTTGSGSSENKSRSKSIAESDTEGESKSRAHGASRSRSSTDSTSHTDTNTNSTTSSRGVAATHSRNQSQTDSKNQSTGLTIGDSHAKSITSSLGWNDSITESSNWSDHQSNTHGSGSSDGGSWSPRKLLFRKTDNWTHWLRQNETRNQNTNQSSSDTAGSGKGGSHAGTQGRSGSSSDGITYTENQSQTQTNSFGQSMTDGQTNSQTESASSSQTHAVGESNSTSHSDTVSASESVTDTVSHSKAHATTATDGITEGASENRHQSMSESVHARRLAPPEDIGRLFDRPAPGQVGLALVILGGGFPTVVARAPYYNDPFFGWLFDPHPDHETPPKLIGNEKFALPGSGGIRLEGRLEQLKLPGEMVDRGELIAEFVEPVSDLDTIHEPYLEYAPAVNPEDYGLSSPVLADVRLPVYAQIEGRVVRHVRRPSNYHRDADNFIILEVNRRRMSLDGFNDAGDALARYAGYLNARKQQERDGCAAYQSERIDNAKLAIVVAERALNKHDRATELARENLMRDEASDLETMEIAEENAKQRFFSVDLSSKLYSEPFVLAGALGGITAGIVTLVMTAGNKPVLLNIALALFLAGAAYLVMTMISAACTSLYLQHTSRDRQIRKWYAFDDAERSRWIVAYMDQELFKNGDTVQDVEEQRKRQRQELSKYKITRKKLEREFERAKTYASEVEQGFSAEKPPALFPVCSGNKTV